MKSFLHKPFILILCFLSLKSYAQQIDVSDGRAFSIQKTQKRYNAVCALGDLNQDGITDIATANDNFGSVGGVGRGVVNILFMKMDGTIGSEVSIGPLTHDFLSTIYWFGTALSFLGDIDGDGTIEIAVGASAGGTSEYIFILSLNNDGTVAKHRTINTPEPYSGFGHAVTCVGDIDNNGFVDLAVGAPYTQKAPGTNLQGSVWILLLEEDGIKSATKLDHTSENFEGTLNEYDYFGKSIAAIGDFDNDGTQDIAVGATGVDGGPDPDWNNFGEDYGAIWILLLIEQNGVISIKKSYQVSDYDGHFLGYASRFGSGITSLGDINNDGVIDLSVGAIRHLTKEPNGKISQGATFILLMNADGSIKEHKMIDTKFISNSGNTAMAVAATDDFNHDGIEDIAVVSDNFFWMINLNAIPRLVNPLQNQTIDAQQLFSFQIPANTFFDANATDADANTTEAITYTAKLSNNASLPAWLTFTADGTFSGTPSDSDIGTLNIIVTATDKAGATATSSFQLTIENQVFTLQADHVIDKKNNIATVPIRIKNFKELIGMQATFEWDPGIASYEDIEHSQLSGLTKNSFGTSQVANGKLFFSWTSFNLVPQTIDDNTVLFNLKLRLIGNPGSTSSVAITNPIEVIGQGLSEKEYETINGSISIKPNVLISGHVTHYDQSLSGVTISVSGSGSNSIITNSEGMYELDLPAGDSYSLTASKGTENNTYLNYLNAADIARIHRHILQTELLSTSYELIAADVNTSKSITTLDKILVESVILGIREFDNQAQWKFVPTNYVFSSSDPFAYPTPLDFNYLLDDVVQDFTAIHLGDVVNNNNTITNGRYNQGNHNLEISIENSEPQNELRLVVRGYGFINSAAMQVSIAFNKSLEFIGVEARTIDPKINITSDSVLRMVWHDINGGAQTITDGSALFVLRFKSKDQDINRKEIFTLSSTLQPEVYNQSLEKNDLSVTWANEPTNVSVDVSQAYPNPFNRFINITVALTEPAEVRLTVLDVNGKTVYNVNHVGEKGINTFHWNGKDSQNNAVSTGTYLIKIQKGLFSESIKVIRIE